MNRAIVRFEEIWHLTGTQAFGRPPSPRGPHLLTWLYVQHLGVSFLLRMEPLK